MGKKVPCKNEECKRLLGVRDVVKVGTASVCKSVIKTVTLSCPKCNTVTEKQYTMK